MDKIKANDYVGAVRDLRQAIEQFKEMGHHASVRSANIFLKEAREASPAAAAADAALARSEAAAEKKRQDAADDPDARRGLLAEAAERRATVTDFT